MKNTINKYVLLSADNIGYDIGISIFDTYDDAYKAIKAAYDETCVEYEEYIEMKDFQSHMAKIICDNSDVFYWNIKEIEC